MERYELDLVNGGNLFIVTDKETGEKVFEGNKIQVEDWLDFRENQLRWEQRKNRKRWYHRFFNVAA